MKDRVDNSEWKSLGNFFSYLKTQKIKYVVLRNHEELFEVDFLKNHSDIDFLCENSDTFVRHAGAVPRGKEKDKVHFQIRIGGRFIPIDVREVGDDYYDVAWETDMLDTRILYRDFCYILNPENYYYSLCYHALLQKRFLSDEYRNKLGCLNPEMKNRKEEEYLKSLEEFMQKKNYTYCYPADRGVVFRYQVVDKKRIKNNTREAIYRKRKECSRRVRCFLKGLFSSGKEV